MAGSLEFHKWTGKLRDLESPLVQKSPPRKDIVLLRSGNG